MAQSFSGNVATLNAHSVELAVSSSEVSTSSQSVDSVELAVSSSTKSTLHRCGRLPCVADRCIEGSSVAINGASGIGFTDYCPRETCIGFQNHSKMDQHCFRSMVPAVSGSEVLTPPKNVNNIPYNTGTEPEVSSPGGV